MTDIPDDIWQKSKDVAMSVSNNGKEDVEINRYDAIEAIAKALLADRRRVSPNLHLIRTFVTDMTDKNWRDKQDYILQQIDRIQG